MESLEVFPKFIDLPVAFEPLPRCGEGIGLILIPLLLCNRRLRYGFLILLFELISLKQLFFVLQRGDFVACRPDPFLRLLYLYAEFLKLFLRQSISGKPVKFVSRSRAFPSSEVRRE